MALNTNEVTRSLYHLGYPITEDLSNYQRFSISNYQDKTKVLLALEKLTPDGEILVRKRLTQLDLLEVERDNARSRTKAVRIGTIELNKNELGQLGREYDLAVENFARMLGVKSTRDPSSGNSVMVMGGF